jgi:hypothetical protein
VGVEAAPAGRVDEVADEVPGLRPLKRGDHLRLARLRPPVGDVVADRAVEERRVPGDDGNCAPKALLRDGGHVTAVDRDAPALDVVEAQEEVDERRLARARPPDDADPFTRPHP